MSLMPDGNQCVQFHANRAVTSIRILQYPQIIPDDPSTPMRDPGSRSLTPMFDKS